MDRKKGYMDKLTHEMRRHPALMIALLAVTVVIGALGGEAFAVDCAGGGGVPSAGLCTISQTVPVAPATCPYVLTLNAGESLLITGTGHIRCDGPGAANTRTIEITVPGGNMEMLAGSTITAENTNTTFLVGGTNGDIAITVSGDFLMHGPASGAAAPAGALGCAPAVPLVTGACISSSDINGGGGKAGNITIEVGNFPNLPAPVGVFTMESGSAVLANHTTGSAGAIVITAGLEMDVDGLVRSFGGIGGIGGAQPPGGGPITLKSGCRLVVTPDGVVSSEGLDPGADLVHLEGCEVEINGIVRSIALLSGGHALPTSPPNHCNQDLVTHPSPPAYTACVEVWGNNVVINSILPNKGEVSADGVRELRAWIDIIAKNNITLVNDTVGNYSVHANASIQAPNSNSFGGVITLKALAGTFQSSNGTAANPGNGPAEAVQANATGIGGDGGIVTIQALLNVVLHTSSIEARALNGSNTRGGTIGVKSFTGEVSGNALAGSELDAFGGGPPGGVLGQVTLSACTNLPFPAGTYGGTITPLPPVVVFPVCDAAGPVAPATFQTEVDCDQIVCTSTGDCIKRGTKFRDLDGDGLPREAGEPGLGGWKIRAYTAAGFETEVTTLADGSYEFNTLTCGVEYTFCEVLQPTWTQTFPPGPPAGQVVSCVGLEPNPLIVLGGLGYKETLVQGQPSVGNDFGNFLPPVECPEDRLAVCTVSVGPNVSIQAAYNAAADGAVICLFGGKDGGWTENVVLNGSKTLKITQCTTAKVTAADPSKPVWTISSTGKLTIVGPDAIGGTVGWLFQTGNHEAKGLRASGASQFGIQVMSNNNSVAWNSANNNAVGVGVSGSFNTLRGGTVEGNTSDGVQISGNSNTLQGATVQSNLGVGINVSGTSNKLKNDKSNTTGPGGTKENGLAEYCVANDTTQDLGSNKKDNANFIGQIAGSPKRYATGCYE